jgi:peptidoglycan/LPS O-acetylase OafA/YrhL
LRRSHRLSQSYRVETLPPPPRLHPERLWSLDALRGVCALVVFLSHWHLWAHIAPRTGWERTLRGSGDFLHDWFSFLCWPQGGHHPAVIGFFVLSGFCIHYPFSRRALATPPIPPDWPGYFRRRFLRIMPVYWTACLLGFAFVAAQQLRPSADPLLILHAHTSWAEALLRLSGLAGVFPKEIFAGNYLLNTVAVEIVMYALYPLIYLAQLRSGWRSVGLAFLAFHLAAVWLLRFVTPYWVFNSVFMLGLFWYFGAFAAHLFNRGIGREIRLPVVLALWVGFLVVKHLPPFYGLNLLKQAAWAGACMIGILWAVSAEQRATTDAADRPLWRALRFVGKLSYSLYAVHTPAIMFATWALLQTSFGTSYLAQLSATMVLSVATTVAVYLGVERICYQPRAR